MSLLRSAASSVHSVLEQFDVMGFPYHVITADLHRGARSQLGSVL